MCFYFLIGLLYQLLWLKRKKKIKSFKGKKQVLKPSVNLQIFFSLPFWRPFPGNSINVKKAKILKHIFVHLIKQPKENVVNLPPTFGFW